MPRLCERCGKRPAVVPDPDRMGRPIRRICAECHRGGLALGVLAVLMHHAKEGARRELDAREAAREAQEAADEKGE